MLRRMLVHVLVLCWVVRTTCGDLLAGSSDTDDDGFAPALVAGLECSAHDVDVAGAVECVVAPVISMSFSWMLWEPSLVGLTKSVAPNFFDHSSLESFTSTTMILPALFLTAPWMTERPTQPAPKTATLEPSSTPPFPAVMTAAP
jgi:hypothetical protein